MTLVAALAISVIAAVACYFNDNGLLALCFTASTFAHGASVYYYLEMDSLSAQNQQLQIAQSALTSQLALFRDDEQRTEQVRQVQALRSEASQIERERTSLQEVRQQTQDARSRLTQILANAAAQLETGTAAHTAVTELQNSLKEESDSEFENVSNSRPPTGEHLTTTSDV